MKNGLFPDTQHYRLFDKTSLYKQAKRTTSFGYIGVLLTEIRVALQMASAIKEAASGTRKTCLFRQHCVSARRR